MTSKAFDLARSQLLDVVEVSDGAVELLRDYSSDAGRVLVVSLDTSGLTPGPGGISVRARERFQITVPDSYPFDHPTVWSVHRRWAGTPHVQFGRLLCLYLAPGVEWDPADGMRGYLARLSQWVERAVAATLDPDDQPLHPPVVYGSPAAGHVIVHPDLGPFTPWSEDGAGEASETVFAWAAAGSARVDVIEWLDRKLAVQRAFADDEPVFDAAGHPFVVLPTVLIPGQLGSEFPRTARALSQGLADHGLSHEQLLWDLSTASLINRRLRKRQLAADPVAAGVPWDAEKTGAAGSPDAEGPAETTDPSGATETAESSEIDEDVPLLTALLIGTPSRRVEGSARLAHLAAWRLDTLSAQIADVHGSARVNDNLETQTELEEIAQRWFKSAKVKWMRLMEARPEVTNRRDVDTPAHWLAGKRVLVMGCGALGGPVAEFCARAGVSELTVADNGVVTPGILVRQLFSDSDIGRSKATALADRLNDLRPNLEVIGAVGNVRTTFLTVDRLSSQTDETVGRDAQVTDPLTAFDLVIDATATASVRSAGEYAFKQYATKPHLVTMVIGHDADRGLVTIDLASATGRGNDTFRKVALLGASGAAGWDDVLDDLFPDPPRTDLFFPEPGCSAPTFVGSAAQTAALAGLMLDDAMRVLSQHAPTPVPGSSEAVEETASSDLLASPTTFASAMRLGSAASHLGVSRAHWTPDLVLQDPVSGFEIRVAASAIAEVRSEVRRGDRTRGPLIETGGMLLGAFDDATGVIHVDRVSGPPPDSYLSSNYFQHGTEGSQDRVTREVSRSRGLSGFVGFWHTHPGGRAFPSPTDEQGMASVVGPDGARRRALMMILGAPEARWAAWRDSHSAQPPDVYVRVVPRTGSEFDQNHPGYAGGRDLQQLPSGGFFRGGFSDCVRDIPTTTVAAAGSAPALTHPGRLSQGPWWRRMRRHP